MTGSFEMGARIASFGWDRARARRLFWVHFPLALVHLPLAFAIIGLPGLLLFGGFALRSWRRWRQAEPVFELHEHGFIDRRQKLTQRQPYSALAGYTLIDRRWRFPFPFSFIHIHHIGLVARINGRHFVVNEHLEGVRDCIAGLQRGALAQRLAGAREALAQDVQLRFGPMAMSGVGLHIGRRTLAWPHLHDVRLGTWRVGRRVENALLFMNVDGKAWDVVTYSALGEPALFVTLLTERFPRANAGSLLRDFCGLDVAIPAAM